MIIDKLIGKLNKQKQNNIKTDNKRALEGDQGKNTGGMGSYSPSRLENKTLNEKIIKKIIEPTLKALKEKNTSFKGFLYAGLMIVNNEPFLIEYNVRMGDPECQTLLPKLKTDFGSIIYECIKGNLSKIDIEWHNDKSLCIVLCSKGYPDEYKKNIEIKNMNKLKLKSNDYLFHAGTSKNNNCVFATGGRVLNFVSVSDNYAEARKRIHNYIESLGWLDGFFRKDIGFKVIDK